MKSLCNHKVVCKYAVEAFKQTGIGPVIEFGVYDGLTSIELRKTLGQDHVQYACDTFEGMPYDSNALELTGGFVKGHLATANKEATLKALRANSIIPIIGKIEDTLPNLAIKNISFAFFDLDLEQATRYAVDWCLPRLAPKGIIAFHDYHLAENFSLTGISTVVHELLPEWDTLYLGNCRTIILQRKCNG